MSKHKRTAALFLMDMVVVMVSFRAAIWLTGGGQTPLAASFEAALPMVVILGCYGTLYAFFHLYGSLWKMAGLNEYLNIVYANVLAGGILAAFGLWAEGRQAFSIAVVAGAFILLMNFGFRILFRIHGHLVPRVFFKGQGKRRRTLIIGAGDAGARLVKEIRNHEDLALCIVGLVDDDPVKWRQRIDGKKILGGTQDIPRIVKTLEVQDIILAIPSITSIERKRILAIAGETGARLHTVPRHNAMIAEGFRVDRIHDVDMMDLLGREELCWSDANSQVSLGGKRVLVTGGAGSIGREICRQVLKQGLDRLSVLDIDENGLHELEMTLRREFPTEHIVIILASVREKEKMVHVLQQERPQVVFHAAAHKHVPRMEWSPDEAVKNNVFGTWNVADASRLVDVDTFILISSDKAVNPTSIMGATKRLCEMLIQKMQEESLHTKFAAVRFGNVLDSRGSVIPTFKTQIEKGGPITLTDPEMTRYFMTIPEAVQLVLQAGTFASGGEVFVLDMGEPIRIYDLAMNYIRLSGLEPYEDIDVHITGVRKGEKLFEELLLPTEEPVHTRNERIFVEAPLQINGVAFFQGLEELRAMVQHPETPPDEVKGKVAELVQSYRHS